MNKYEILAKFKTEVLGKSVKRFGDIPADAGHSPVSDRIKRMVLHVVFPIIDGHNLMGTDALKGVKLCLA